jgi:hypoxanthine phosphoribosyltransferase
VVLTIDSNRKNRKLKAVVWSDIQSATKFFWKKLNRKKFEPTFIIAPGQKGGIIAQLIDDFYEEEIPILSGFLETKDKEQVEDDNYMTLKTTKWYVHMPISLKTCKQKERVKLLIVDDFVMSGDFLYSLKNQLLELGYLEKNICSCAIVVTKVAKDANKAPDYYWKVVDDKDFYFPWGKAE